VTIRAATLADIAPIAELDESVFGMSAYGPTTVRQLLDLFGELCFVAENGSGTIVGYCMGGVASRDRIGWVLVLAVVGSERRRGVGRNLSESTISALEGSGAAALRLTVEPSSSAAIALYTSLGFQHDKVERDYFGPGHPRIVMWRGKSSRV
jgi:ribosomal-protein-alanine N-acetyltransferase